MDNANNLLAHIKKPSESQAKVLNNLFSIPGINVHLTMHTERKKKFQPVKTKDTSVTVVMLNKYQSTIPRGEVRQELSDNNRVQQVAINRSYSPAKVRDVILAAFGCKDFSTLECAKGGYLLRAEDKELTSQLAIDRRGALYLCETSNVRVSILVGM